MKSTKKAGGKPASCNLSKVLMLEQTETEFNERILITANAAWLLSNNSDGSLNIRLIGIEPPFDNRLITVVQQTKLGFKREGGFHQCDI